MLNVGDTLPTFTLQDHIGASVNSADLIGKTVVFFFYPKADTPG